MGDRPSPPRAGRLGPHAMTHDAHHRQSGLRFTARAFRHRNYRLFFSGQGISLLGTWMQQIAMSWLIYRLTGSPFYLGLIGFTSQIPTFLFSSFAGVLADRHDRRRLLILIQALSMVQAFLLAILTLTNTILIWHIVLLSIFLGCMNAFDIPTRHSFVVDIVTNKKDLGNAIALNSFMFNGARLAGPSIAGILIGIAGEGVCFLINGFSFLAVIAALLGMQIPRKRKDESRGAVLHGLKEGYRYAAGFLPIRYILLFLGLISFVGMPYYVLLPVFAKDILHGGSGTLGFLMGAAGAGALTGALYLASRKTVRGLGRLVTIAAFMFGTSLVAFSFSRHLLLSVFLMFATGLSVMLQSTSCNTILQTIVDEEMRGRVMGFLAMAFIGMAPFGSLLAGIIADRIGAPNTLVISGVILLAGAFLFYSRLPAIRRLVRPIYAKMGIIKGIPEELR